MSDKRTFGTVDQIEQSIRLHNEHFERALAEHLAGATLVPMGVVMSYVLSVNEIVRTRGDAFMYPILMMSFDSYMERLITDDDEFLGLVLEAFENVRAKTS